MFSWIYVRSIEMPSKIYKLYILYKRVYKRTLLDFSALSIVFFLNENIENNC